MKIADSCIICDSKNILSSPAVLMPFIANRIFDWQPVQITKEWDIKDLKQGWAYPLCNSLFCQNCEMLFLDMRFNDEEMTKLYNDYRGASYAKSRVFFEPNYLHKNKILTSGAKYVHKIESVLKKYVPSKPKILDFGGDTGINTPFKNIAQLHHIYDISGCNTIKGAIAVDIKSLTENYDLIVCSQILEHTPFPKKILSDILQIAKPNTIISIDVPFEKIVSENFGKKDIYKKKKHWHEHINFYSEKSIIKLCNICGIEILDIIKIQVETFRKAEIICLVGKKRDE